MRFLIFIILLYGIVSCSTYTIPVQSFKQQFENIDTSNFRMVEINVPLAIGYTYTESKSVYPANPIDTIICFDDNKQINLANGPSIEIRFTDNNDESEIFYFDTIYLKDSLIIGAYSRYLPTLRDTININKVKLIEVQDGKKNFHYIEK